jgi:hypothetical protein
VQIPLTGLVARGDQDPDPLLALLVALYGLGVPLQVRPWGDCWEVLEPRLLAALGQAVDWGLLAEDAAVPCVLVY